MSGTINSKLQSLEEKQKSGKKNNFKLPPSMKCEVCILMDITGSMQSYVNSTKEALNKLVQEFDGIFGNGFTRLKFIGYRDYEDPTIDSKTAKDLEFEDIDFDEYQDSQLYKQLDSIKCTGGGDAPEDIKGALSHTINKINWKGKLKFILLVADAPAHGTMYNSCKDNHKTTPDGKTQDLSEELDQMISKGIRLIILRVGSVSKQTMLKQMVDQIQKQLNEKQAADYLVDQSIGETKIEELTKQLVVNMSTSIRRMFNQTINSNKMDKIGKKF